MAKKYNDKLIYEWAKLGRALGNKTMFIVQTRNDDGPWDFFPLFFKGTDGCFEESNVCRQQGLDMIDYITLDLDSLEHRRYLAETEE